MRTVRVTDPRAVVKRPPSKCESLKPDPTIWERVLEITGGDTSRVVMHSTTSVVVYNTEEQARAARKQLKR